MKQKKIGILGVSIPSRKQDIRSFEDSILDRVTLSQELEELPAVQVLSFILQIMGYSQREIAEVGNRTQQGIKYHVDKVKRVMSEQS